jgi:hypothetical protein
MAVTTPIDAPHRNVYKGIRKLRKAQWVYECSLCGTTTPPAPDLFGVSEAKRRHINSPQHIGKTFNAMADAYVSAFSHIADAFMGMAQAVTSTVLPAVESFASAFAAPPNIPHDPSLRNDKRKWGGK